MKKGFLIIIGSLFLITSCSRQITTNNGAFSDVALNRSGNEYELKRLKEIEVKGGSFWGIPNNKKNNPNKNKAGIIFRINGVSLGKTPKIVPVLSLLSYSAAIGFGLQQAVGRETIRYNFNMGGYQNTQEYKGDYKLPLSLAFVFAIPIAGTLNNLTWSQSSYSGISNEIHYRLLNENPDIDVFLNPKYTIDYRIGLWNQSSIVKLKAMGAKIKTDN